MALRCKHIHSGVLPQNGCGTATQDSHRVCDPAKASGSQTNEAADGNSLRVVDSGRLWCGGGGGACKKKSLKQAVFVWAASKRVAILSACALGLSQQPRLTARQF